MWHVSPDDPMPRVALPFVKLRTGETPGYARLSSTGSGRTVEQALCNRRKKKVT